ncbi:trypsin-like serine protease [Rozella allomycis CSF55]|uniref:Peptidase S1, trypsin family domain-containing protein n=1 Tax=Rozella allomycis (strain CSF55) TaxID=988480 RepID=A0A075ATL3_ROZAC|nr:Peptidase S1, trypsin family domain-containing protein [Rozella allomycis CSF55]RKP18141.1 trypsin-like serine protease [Rozella allomycis CSF55]|eukprot:EPZ33601.1 Peptidase S1, trypsin family domain-containing protein [Rozella allomycis CSF55]
MKAKLILSGLLFCLLGSSSCHFLISQNIDERIVGGEPVIPFIFPFAASIQCSGYHFCGGALISDTILISAGHCVISSCPISSLRVFVHRHNINLPPTAENSTVFTVVQISRHPKYNGVNYENDISVWKLRKIVSYDEPLKFAMLDKGDLSREGTKTMALGWGYQKFGVPVLSSTLLFVNLPIVNPSICKRIYEKYFFMGKQLCVGGDVANKDTCQGDSGGGLFVTDSSGKIFIVGIVSWGYECGRVGYPGVYTKISSFLDWIHDTVNSLN